LGRGGGGFATAIPVGKYYAQTFKEKKLNNLIMISLSGVTPAPLTFSPRSFNRSPAPYFEFALMSHGALSRMSHITIPFIFHMLRCRALRSRIVSVLPAVSLEMRAIIRNFYARD